MCQCLCCYIIVVFVYVSVSTNSYSDIDLYVPLILLRITMLFFIIIGHLEWNVLPDMVFKCEYHAEIGKHIREFEFLLTVLGWGELLDERCFFDKSYYCKPCRKSSAGRTVLFKSLSLQF